MKRLALVALLTVGCASSSSSYVPKDLADRAVPPPTVRAASQEVAGDAPPAPFARRRRAMPAPTEARLSNGVRVLLLERHEFPSATVTFVVDRGESAAAEDVAEMYVNASRGATKDYTRKEAFDFLAYLGAHTSSWSRMDGIGFDVTVLSPFLSKALAPVASMFTTASFESDDVGFARTAVKSEVDTQRTSPSSQASIALSRMLFGNGHPYARGGGSAEVVDAIGAKQLEAFRDAYLVADRVTVLAVGDFDPAKLTARLEHLLAPLPRKKAGEAPVIAPLQMPAAARITLVPRKGASQSNVALGFPGARRGDEAHAALRVLSVLLGRGLSGRLDLKIRGEHGYTYGVRVRDIAYRDAGVFQITTAVETAHTAESLKGLVAELARMRTEAVEPAELARAKHQALDELATEHLGGSSLYVLALGGLPLGYYEETAKRIEALDAAALRAAAERFLITDKVQIAVVGDEAAIRDPLRSLGLGEVTVQPSR